MNRLFIDIYLDEDVDVLIADLLRARGFVAMTTRDTGNLGVSDSHQLNYAVSGQKALLTHNRVDFGRPLLHRISQLRSPTLESSSLYGIRPMRLLVASL